MFRNETHKLKTKRGVLLDAAQVAGSFANDTASLCRVCACVWGRGGGGVGSALMKTNDSFVST